MNGQWDKGPLAGFGSNRLTPSSGYASPDAMALVVLDGPSETLEPARTQRTDRQGAQTIVRPERKEQFSVVAETQGGLAPPDRVQVRFVSRWSEVWRKQRAPGS